MSWTFCGTLARLVCNNSRGLVVLRVAALVLNRAWKDKRQQQQISPAQGLSSSAQVRQLWTPFGRRLHKLNKANVEITLQSPEAQKGNGSASMTLQLNSQEVQAPRTKNDAARHECGQRHGCADEEQRGEQAVKHQAYLQHSHDLQGARSTQGPERVVVLLHHSVQSRQDVGMGSARCTVHRTTDKSHLPMNHVTQEPLKNDLRPRLNLCVPEPLEMLRCKALHINNLIGHPRLATRPGRNAAFQIRKENGAEKAHDAHQHLLKSLPFRVGWISTKHDLARNTYKVGHHATQEPARVQQLAPADKHPRHQHHAQETCDREIPVLRK
mmetsp:Transcript_5417/g.15500  ORF Transcript_5417/g.15500 Transcript_5417/m.15500 type:complete len:326 (-) Transcript_5417:167-1144(-)